MDVAGVFRGIGYARYWQKETWNRNKRLCFVIYLHVAGNCSMQTVGVHRQDRITSSSYNPGFVGSTEDNSLVSPTLQLTSFPP